MTVERHLHFFLVPRFVTVIGFIASTKGVSAAPLEIGEGSKDEQQSNTEGSGGGLLVSGPGQRGCDVAGIL